jgi:hypothetical protein
MIAINMDVVYKTFVTSLPSFVTLLRLDCGATRPTNINKGWAGLRCNAPSFFFAYCVIK